MKKNIRMIGGIVALVILLVGAAYIGGRLLTGQELPAAWSGLPFLGGGDNGQPVRTSLFKSEELPETDPAAGGVFDHRQDKSIFIGTGRARVGMDENGNVSSQHDGPIVEIVVTTQTVIYKDVTMRQYDGPPPDGQEIQQVVEAGTLDEIGQGSFITVWGRKTGDRFIADVLVYSSPN
jgi:hypothetical protein